MKIAILKAHLIDGHEAETRALPAMFPHAEIMSLAPEDITAESPGQFDMLFLPGILGENSPYPDYIPADKALWIDRHIRQNGLVLWAECAATCLLLKSYEYVGSDGMKRSRTGHGFIDGTGRGPTFATITQAAPRSSNRLTDKFRFHVVTDIKSEENPFATYQALDINGSEIILSPDSSFCEIFKYTNLSHMPVCGIIQERGLGLLMAFSFHAPIPFSNLPFSHHGQEDNRMLFLQHQANRITAHINRKRKILVPTPQIRL